MEKQKNLGESWLPVPLAKGTHLFEHRDGVNKLLLNLGVCGCVAQLGRLTPMHAG